MSNTKLTSKEIDEWIGYLTTVFKSFPVNKKAFKAFQHASAELATFLFTKYGEINSTQQLWIATCDFCENILDDDDDIRLKCLPDWICSDNYVDELNGYFPEATHRNWNGGYVEPIEKERVKMLKDGKIVIVVGRWVGLLGNDNLKSKKKERIVIIHVQYLTFKMN